VPKAHNHEGSIPSLATVAFLWSVTMLYSLVVACTIGQLVKDDTYYRSLLPKTEDVTLKEILERKNLVFYTDTEIPPAHQHSGTVISTKLNISANRSEPFGNPNREFPWLAAAGTHRSTNFKKFNFLSLPSPIVCWEEHITAVTGRLTHNKEITDTIKERNLRWRFPDKSIVGEVLLLQEPKGRWYTFDIRTRTKDSGAWRMNAYRPFSSFQQMQDWLGATKIEYSIENQKIKSTHPDQTVFESDSAIQTLGKLPNEVVRKMLLKPFVSARESVWIRNGKIPGFAPTTKEDFHIVPKDYTGGFVRVNNVQCMRCHTNTMKEAGDFDFQRDWYGRVRGDDNIFTFHPFEPSSVSMVYTPDSLQPYQLNKKMIAAGIIIRRK